MTMNNNGKNPIKKFLFVGHEALSGDLAWSLTKEGHEVRIFIDAPSDRDCYDGFLEKVDDWKKHVKWADVIVFDDVEFGADAEKLRAEGKFVIGGTIYTDNLEIDREFGQAELKKNGVSILPCQQFSSYDEGIRFIQENPGRYVYKPSGNTFSGGKGLLFLGEEEDGKDLIELLEQNKIFWEKKAPVFLLQKHISGVEVAVGAFFNGKKFIYPIFVNFEHKRIFPGDVGPFAGEMGTLAYWSSPNVLFRATLEKMETPLRETGYVGYVDINCIVNGKGIYPLEFTTRFGYPTIQIQMEGLTTPAGEWLYLLAKGEDFELKTKKGFQVCVRILVPTYFSHENDLEQLHMYKDLAVTFKNTSNLDGIHIEDVKNDNGTWRIAGSSGVVLVVSASGPTVEDARRLVYNRLHNIIIPNMFYRTDIGEAWSQDSDRLHTWGYLR